MNRRQSFLAILIMSIATISLAAGTYDGVWSGQTSQSEELSFTITADRVMTVEINAMVSSPACTTHVFLGAHPSSPVNGNAIAISQMIDMFEGEVWSYTVNGTFSSPTRASGTMTFAVTGSSDCNGTASATWTAWTGTPPACTYTLNPSRESFSSGASGGEFIVTGSPAGCTGEWSAVSRADWISVRSGNGSGSGDGYVFYDVAANSSTQRRAGSISVGAASFEITQDGRQATNCVYSISPRQATFFGSGGQGGLLIRGAPDDCEGDWTATSTADWITVLVPPGFHGVGPLPLDLPFTVKENWSGTARTGAILVGGESFTVTQLSPGPTSFSRGLVVPVVAKTPGAFGAFFRTSAQLHNPNLVEISGVLTYRPAGTSASYPLPYVLGPDQTIDYLDLLAAFGQTGFGTLDVSTGDGSEPPLLVMRMYNDGGRAGTAGMAMEAMTRDDALGPGQEGRLFAPVDTNSSRLNVGVRTLDDTTVTIRVLDRSGGVRTSIRKSWPGEQFEQVSSSSFAGLILNASDVIAIRVESGLAYFYGATTDNRTQDSSIQFARSRP